VKLAASWVSRSRRSTVGNGSLPGSASRSYGGCAKSRKKTGASSKRFLRVGFGVSERRACRVIPVHRSTQRYRSQRSDQIALRQRLRDLTTARVRYSYRRLHVLLQREGWRVNHKRVYRLYREEGLGIRRTDGGSGSRCVTFLLP
jgi:hypothetical protein